VQGQSIKARTPPGKQYNRVQTISDKGWNTILRLYGPLEPWLNKTWRLASRIRLRQPPGLPHDTAADRGYFGFSWAFFNKATTSAHSRMNTFCSSAGSPASADLSRMPTRSVSVLQ
jgi:hypothetical protein